MTEQVNAEQTDTTTAEWRVVEMALAYYEAELVWGRQTEDAPEDRTDALRDALIEAHVALMNAVRALWQIRGEQ